MITAITFGDWFIKKNIRKTGGGNRKKCAC